VNKSQLIDTLATRYEGNRKQAAHALESVIDTITREVARGEKVAITGFGSFEKRVRDARWVRNPRTGERIKAKKTAIPKFSAGAELKAVVSGAKKLPKLTLTAATTTAKAATNGGTARKSAPTKKTAAKSTASKSTASKSTASKSTASKSTTSKATASKSTASKATAAKKSPAKKTATPSTAAKKAPAKKTTAKKSTAKKSS
jgi:DNA-binding protein HU-beta